MHTIWAISMREYGEFVASFSGVLCVMGEPARRARDLYIFVQIGNGRRGSGNLFCLLFIKV